MPKKITVTFDMEGDAKAEDVASYLEASVCDLYPPYQLSNPTVFLETPVVIVQVKDGMAATAIAEIPVNAIVHDYDGDMMAIPQRDGTEKLGCVEQITVDVNPEWIKKLIED